MNIPLIFYGHDLKSNKAYKSKKLVQNASTPICVRKGKKRKNYYGRAD